MLFKIVSELSIKNFIKCIYIIYIRGALIIQKYNNECYF